MTIEYVGDKMSIQDIVNLITELLKKVLNFIAKSEGYVTEAE